MGRLFDLELLKALVAIAETGSLSAAAPRLCRSQSAVSEQVRKLEAMCGRQLLLRGKTGATLTAAGERLLNHARKLLAMSDVALRDMQGVQLAGSLHLAITDYFRPTIMPTILGRIRDRFPHLHLHVSVLKSATIEAEMGSGKFDIGLSMVILDGLESNNESSTGRRIRLRRESLLWISHESFETPKHDALPLVVLPDSCSLQRFVTGTLRANGVRYTISHSASGIGGLHLALAAGLGITCLNSSAIPEGAKIIADAPQLPTMPEVEFNISAPRAGESTFVSEARDMLVEQLK